MKSVQASQPASMKSSEMLKRSALLHSDYRYNLFNLLDNPINSNCSANLCAKNDIIAPKIKKRW